VLIDDFHKPIVAPIDAATTAAATDNDNDDADVGDRHRTPFTTHYYTIDGSELRDALLASGIREILVRAVGAKVPLREWCNRYQPYLTEGRHRIAVATMVDDAEGFLRLYSATPRNGRGNEQFGDIDLDDDDDDDGNDPDYDPNAPTFVSFTGPIYGQMGRAHGSIQLSNRRMRAFADLPYAPVSLVVYNTQIHYLKGERVVFVVRVGGIVVCVCTFACISMSCVCTFEWICVFMMIITVRLTRRIYRHTIRLVHRHQPEAQERRPEAARCAEPNHL